MSRVPLTADELVPRPPDEATMLTVRSLQGRDTRHALPELDALWTTSGNAAFPFRSCCGRDAIWRASPAGHQRWG